MKDKSNLYYKIAKLYYEDKMSQDEIAKIFNISCATVSRNLKEAEKKNIIQIKVVDLPGLTNEIRNRLKKKYDLREAIVSYVPYNDTGIIKRYIGKEASKILINFIKENQSIGLAWGTTLYEMVNFITPRTINNLTVVELVGNIGRIANEFDVSEIARKFALNFNARRYVLQAPGLVSSVDVKNALLFEKNIIDVMKLGKNVDVAIVGIGSVESRSQIYKTLNFSDYEVREIISSGAVGDICFRFFSEEGYECKLSFDERIVGIDLSNFREIPLRIGIAGGENKVDPIRAALKGCLINILVTDNYTAEKLL